MRSLSLASRLALLLLVVLSAACQDFLDVNDNPNSPEEVPENLMLSGIVGTFGFGVLGSWPSSLGAEWTQQIAYNGERDFMKIEKYELNESEAGRLWGLSYTDIMNSARALTTQAEANGNHVYAGIAQLISAWSLSVVTDMWGPVPYSEAWDPANPTPAYDTQQQVYAGVMLILDSAITNLELGGGRLPGRDDLLYDGDVGKWQRLAHTLKARLELQLSTAPGENTAGRLQTVLAELQEGFAGNADDADFVYQDEEGQRNPWYRARLDNRIQMSATYVELLRSLDDPRLIVQANAADSTGLYTGHPNGEPGELVGDVSAIGDHYAAGDAVQTWLSYAEAKFMEAEARLRTEGGAAAADAPYREGIRANMEKLGVPAGDIDSYIAARPALSAVANPLAEIITQKYIANFLNYQEYNDWRRTGYPTLTPVADALLDAIPVRLRTPGSELANNAASVQATGISPGLDGMLVHVWWDPE